jgi:hypothetical protein
VTCFDADRGARLRCAVDDAVAGWLGVAARTTFGRPTRTADGTGFAVVLSDAVVLTRLSDDRRAELAGTAPAAPCRAGDRTVVTRTQVPVDGPAALESLRPYLTASDEAALAESPASARPTPPPVRGVPAVDGSDKPLGGHFGTTR